MLRIRRFRARWSTTLGVLLLVASGMLVLSPVISVWLSDSLRRHAYHEVSFAWVARDRLPRATSERQVVLDAMDYVRQQVWLFHDSRPYDGKPFDFLVEGVGFCDYTAKATGQLVAARGIHARYDFLRDPQGGSPHAILEVLVDGEWRAIDPFYRVVYARPDGQWARLDELTADFVAQLPELQLIKPTGRPYAEIMANAQRTYPLPHSPDRSDDFLAEKHVLDRIAHLYVRWFGSRFAHWYQDQYLKRHEAALESEDARLWYRARHYHLYNRVEAARVLYDTLLRQHPDSRYRERVTLFLSQMLIQQGELVQARAMLEAYLGTHPWARWADYYLAQCYEALGDVTLAARHYQRVAEDIKLAQPALRRLASLGIGASHKK